MEKDIEEVIAKALEERMFDTVTRYSQSDSAPSFYGVYITESGQEYEVTIQRKK